MTRGHKLISSLLTLNAILLGVLLWVQVAERPMLAGTATAQIGALPNAGGQRDRMIVLLAKMSRSVEETKSLLERGKVRVVVVPDTPPTRTPPTEPPTPRR